MVFAWVWASQVILGSFPPFFCFPVVGWAGARCPHSDLITTITVVDPFLDYKTSNYQKWGPETTNQPLQYSIRQGVVRGGGFSICCRRPSQKFPTSNNFSQPKFGCRVVFYSWCRVAARWGIDIYQSVLASIQSQLLPGLAVVGAAVWMWPGPGELGSSAAQVFALWYFLWCEGSVWGIFMVRGECVVSCERRVYGVCFSVILRHESLRGSP